MSPGKHIAAVQRLLSQRGLSQLRLAFVLVGLLASIPLLLALVYFSNQQRSEALDDAHEHLEILTAVYASTPDPTEDVLSEALRAELSEHAEYISFVLENAELVSNVHPPDVAPDLSADSIAALNRGTASGEPFLHEIDGRSFFFARTAAPDGSLVFVGLPAEPIFASVESAIRRHALTLTIVFLVSVIIGLFGSEVLIFGPLESLSRTAQALRAGDLSARSRIRGVGEVAQLASAIDRLAESVQDRQTRLEQARAQAERARQQADAASGAKSDFLASMSHEIRTPLHSIVGHAELLLGGLLTPGQRRHARQVEAGAQAVLDVVNDVLDLALIEAGKVRLNRQPLVLYDLIDNAMSIVGHFAERKELKLTADIDPQLPELVMGDQSRIRQVLLNFLNNAIKFTSEGSVTLCVRKAEPEQGEMIEFSVTDTGAGIPVEEQHRLFQRFSQLGPVSAHGGAGLGLSISKHLVEQMGGVIGFRSEPGKGATFWARLPLPACAPGVGETALAPAAGDRRLSILLADDVRMNTEIACAMLEAAGHTVEVAHNGEEAVALARKRKYDVILMDVQMSPLDGPTASRIIRGGSGPNSDTAIVAMTANVLPEQISRYREAGMIDYISKPFARSALLAKLNAIVDKTPLPAPATLDEQTLPEFDRAAFDELASLLSESQLSSWVEKLRHEIDRLLVELRKEPPDRAELARLCHGIVSHAGSMGFARLAQACRDLEEACFESDAELGSPCAAVRSSAEQVLKTPALRKG